VLRLNLAFTNGQGGIVRGGQTVGKLSGQCHRKFWGCGKLRFLLSLAVGAVEQNRVALEFPNRRKFHAAWTMQAEKQATGLVVAHQDAFRDVKGSYLQFVVMAKGGLNVLSQLIQVVNGHLGDRHRGIHLLGCSPEKLLPRRFRSAKDDNDGCLDKLERLGKVPARVTIGKLGWQSLLRCLHKMEGPYRATRIPSLANRFHNTHYKLKTETDVGGCDRLHFHSCRGKINGIDRPTGAFHRQADMRKGSPWKMGFVRGHRARKHLHRRPLLGNNLDVLARAKSRSVNGQLGMKKVYSVRLGTMPLLPQTRFNCSLP
jgi:hypothetical protein